jgi:hypothetical protein
MRRGCAVGAFRFPKETLGCASPSSSGWSCCISSAADLAGSAASSSSLSSASSSQGADEREPRRQPPVGLVALRDEQRKGPFWGVSGPSPGQRGCADRGRRARGRCPKDVTRRRSRNSVMARNRVAQRCYYPCLTLPRSPGGASL